VGSISAVFNEPEVVLPCRDRTGTASDCLEICIRNPSYDFDCREKGRAHSVTPCYILGTAFRHEHAALACDVRKSDCIEIVRAFRRCDDLDAVVQWLLEPQCIDVVFRDRKKQRNIVVGTYFCKSTSCVACRGNHENLFIVLWQSCTYGIGLCLFERACLHPCAFLRAIA